METHFESLLNSSFDTSKKSHVLNNVKKCAMSFVRFSIIDVRNVIKSL